MISINFLPAEQKEKNKWQLVTRFVFFYCLLFVSIVGVFIVTLFVFNYFLKGYRDDLKGQVEGFKQGKLAVQVSEAEKEIKDKNKEIEAILLLSENGSHWSSILKNIAENVPEGITIANMSLNGDGNVTISGHADVREQLLAFKSNLESSKYVSSVTLPFSDLTKRTDITYHITFVLKEGSIQGDPAL